MRVLEEAYFLVKSMTKHEKGFFIRLQSSNKADSKILNAYNALNKCKEYDQGLLKQQMQAIGATPGIQRHLLFALLKALDLRQQATSETYELNATLNHVETLYNKKRFQFCKELVDKGLKLSRETGNEPYALMFAIWEYRLDGLQLIEAQESELEAWHESNMNTVTELKTKLGLLHLLGKQKSFLLKSAPSEASVEIMRNIVLDSGLQEFDKPKSIEGKFHYYSILFRSYMYTGRFELALEESLKLLALVETGFQNKTQLGQYVILRFNILRLCVFLRKDELYFLQRNNLLEFLQSKTAKTHKEYLDNLTFQNIPMIHAFYLACNGRVEYLNNHLECNSDSLLVSTDGHTGLELEIGTLQSWAWFVDGNFRESMRSIDAVLGMAAIKKTERLWHMAKWLELIICVELKDASMFDSRFRSLVRHIKTRDGGFEFELRLLDQLKTSMQSADTQQAFKAIIEEDFMDVEVFRSLFIYIDVFSWLKAQAQGLSLKTYYEFDQ